MRNAEKHFTEICLREFSRERPHLSSFQYSLFGNLLPSLAGPTTVGLFSGSYLIALVESHHLSTRRTIETFPLNGKYSLAAPMIILVADAKRICMTVKKCAEIGFISTIARSRRCSPLLLSTVGLTRQTPSLH